MTGQVDVADKSRYRANLKDLDVSYYKCFMWSFNSILGSFLFPLQSDVSDGEESNEGPDEETKESKETKKTGIYKIPKLAAVPYGIFSISFVYVELISVFHVEVIVFCRSREQRRKTETATGSSEKKGFEFNRNAGIERIIFWTTIGNNEY